MKPPDLTANSGVPAITPSFPCGRGGAGERRCTPGGLTSESESDELELEELEESLELSEAMPVDSCRSTESARTASSGCSCFKILETRP